MFGKLLRRELPKPTPCPGCEARDRHIHFLENRLLLHSERLQEENRLMRDQVLAMANRPQALSEGVRTEEESPREVKSSEEVELEQAELEISRIGARARRELDQIAKGLNVPVETLMDIPP